MSLRALSVLAVLACATPAFAQPARPNEEVTVRWSVSTWGPKNARPGDTITIEGKAFGPNVVVTVGGKPVRADSGRAKITFRAPDDAGGELRLTKPGQEDIVLGALVIAIPTDVTAFNPARGAPGTQVAIKGRGFLPTDEVRIGGRKLTGTVVGPTTIKVTIDDGAKTGPFAVYRGGAKVAESARPFTVIAPAPIVVSLKPAGGPPDAVVRVSGQYFAPTDLAYYGRKPIEIVGRGNDWIDVRIPGNARQAQPIAVRGEGGEGVSRDPYQLELPQAILDFRPRQGAPGSTVEIKGTWFRPGDLLLIGGKRADVTDVTPTKLTATVPHGTPGGEVVVKRGEYEAKARGTFQVLVSPTITGFVPSKGEVGTRVTLTGTWLGGGDVYFGGTRLTLTKGSEKALEFVIPKGASTNTFRVKTPAGEVTAAKPFEVVAYATIVDARPRRVTIGGSTQLIGGQLDSVEKVMLGGVELPITNRQQRALTVTIPPGAADGKLAWYSGGGRRDESSFTLTVLRPPSIASFQPEEGVPGTQVILRGEAFDPKTKLFYGELPMNITQRGPNQLTAIIPAKATGKEYLWVQGDGERVRSSSTFTVRAAIAFDVIEPGHGKPGDRVMARGQFDASTDILIGAWRATVIKKRKPIRAGEDLWEVEVPAGATVGSFDAVARSGGQTVKARNRFTVDPAAPPPPPAPALAIDGFAPPTVEHGGKVQIQGVGFGPKTEIKIDGRKMPVTKVAPDGRSLWIVVANTVVGEQYVDAIDGPNRARSSGRLNIVEEKGAGGVNTRDHRDKDKDKDKGAGGVNTRDHRDKDKPNKSY